MPSHTRGRQLPRQPLPIILRKGEHGFVNLAEIIHALDAIGLGARDSLRLEAGLCLYGHDLDPGKTPVEATLSWVIQKNRREAADFPGAERILHQIENGPRIKRVGIQPLDRAPAREGTEIMFNDVQIGEITSGGFGPSVEGPVAMGYVEADHAKIGTELTLMVRGKPRAARVAKLPFVPHNYKR